MSYVIKIEKDVHYLTSVEPDGLQGVEPARVKHPVVGPVDGHGRRQMAAAARLPSM